MNAGNGGSNGEISNFFTNFTGLQWTTTPDAPGSDADEFGGWLGEFDYFFSLVRTALGPSRADSI